jgi:cytochrome c
VDQLAVRYSSAADTTFELRVGAPDGDLLATVPAPSTGSLTRFADAVVDVPDGAPTESFALYLVMPGAEDRRVNFVEAIGLGVSDDSHPQVRITAPEAYQPLVAGEQVQVTASASDPSGTITGVEFFVGETSLGADDTAPYTASWTPANNGYFNLTAVARNDEGRETTSRIVVAQVGEPFGDFEQFTNAGGVFEPTENGFSITSGGANMWQATDEYSSLYLPQGADEDWSATVKIASQGNSNGSAKAGIFVRNDVTQPSESPGYAALGIRPANGFEWLRDSDGNGELDASTGASTTSYPAWVRVARAGNQYYSYWSKNGTDFTQIGGPVTLPGAAAVQDVGLFVTAHSATATSEVSFTDWTFDDEWTPPTAWEPDPLPTCEVQQSDEFTGDTLNATRWTTRRTAPDQQISVADGSLRLPVTQGDINEAATGPISFVGQPARTGEWTATTKVTLAHSRQWQHAGMMLHASDNEYVKLAFTRNNAGGRILEFQTETNGVRSWHANVGLPAGFPATAYLRLTSNGSNLTAAYSTDGDAWTALAGQAPLKTNAALGLMAAGDTGAVEATAHFDWYRVTPDSEGDGAREFDDEFEGSGLDGCRWDRTVRYESSKLAVSSGALRITTEPGDINGNNAVSPHNFVLQDAPEGDWTVETRLTPTMVHRWQYAGLLAYGDDNNYVKFDVVANNAVGSPLSLRAEMVSEVNGSFGAGGNRSIDIPETSESGWFYLRLTRTGSTYSAWISDGGVNWTSLGEPVTNAGNLTSLGLVAVGPEQATPVTVAFDWIRLAADEPEDTTAPTTTADLSPATPDGAGGWYVGAPTLSLTADDGDGSGVASTEFRVDDGDWTAYTDPVVIGGDGTHTVRYRSTDEAGNLEEVRQLEVEVDGTAPVTTAETSGSGGEVTVALTAEDATAGVARTEYQVDGGEWKPYADPVVVTGDGTHVLGYRSVDAAGNVEATKAVTVDVDGTGPILAVSGVAHGQVYGDSESLALDWEAYDAGSGVGQVTATLDGQPVARGELRLDGHDLGLHELVVSATDNAGNETEQVLRFGTATSFVDLAELVRLYHAEDRLTVRQHDTLLDLVSKASDAAVKGKRAKAIAALDDVIAAASNVSDTFARGVLTRDARALQERLSGRQPAQAGALLVGDRDRWKVAPLE